MMARDPPMVLGVAHARCTCLVPPYTPGGSCLLSEEPAPCTEPPALGSCIAPAHLPGAAAWALTPGPACFPWSCLWPAASGSAPIWDWRSHSPCGGFASGSLPLGPGSSWRHLSLQPGGQAVAPAHAQGPAGDGQVEIRAECEVGRKVGDRRHLHTHWARVLTLHSAHIDSSHRGSVPVCPAE